MAQLDNPAFSWKMALTLVSVCVCLCNSLLLHVQKEHIIVPFFYHLFAIAERIDGLETQVVCLVASGEMHSVAVNDAGRIFTWGDNRFSQLGRQTPSEVTSSTPKSVASLPVVIFRC